MESETTKPAAEKAGFNYGPLVIIGIFGVSLALAVFAWFYRYYHGRQSLEFWGSENAASFYQAEQLAMLDITPAQPGQGEVIGGIEFEIVSSFVSTDHRDVADLRRVLLQDQSFQFDETLPPDQVEWDHAFVFEWSPGNAFPILFSSSQGMIYHEQAERAVKLTPSFAKGLQYLLKPKPPRK